MPGTRHFTPAIYKFLKDLSRNNQRDWFKENKSRYEKDVKEPALQFIIDFGSRLGKISRQFRADPRPVGGSLFRIYRDIRFSKDKSPYKNHAGLHFRHAAGKDAYTPGFYLHIEPGGSFVGIGIWHPDSKTLKKIRNHIVAQPQKWKRAVGSKVFTARYEVTGDRLIRPPKGCDPEHPLIETLKLKDITALARYSQRDVTSAGFIDRFAADCRAGAPMVEFICEALDVPF